MLRCTATYLAYMYAPCMYAPSLINVSWNINEKVSLVKFIKHLLTIN